MALERGERTAEGGRGKVRVEWSGVECPCQIGEKRAREGGRKRRGEAKLILPTLPFERGGERERVLGA